jgi:hypothetical protein
LLIETIMQKEIKNIPIRQTITPWRVVLRSCFLHWILSTNLKRSFSLLTLLHADYIEQNKSSVQRGRFGSDKKSMLRPDTLTTLVGNPRKGKTQADLHPIRTSSHSEL